MKNTRTKKPVNPLNLFITPLTIYLAMVCDKIAARDAQQPIGTQALADPEVASLTPESEAINITDEQLKEPTLAQHTIDTDYEPELPALFNEIQAEPLAVTDLLTTANNSAAGTQASAFEDTYTAHESLDDIPSITVGGPSDGAMPADDDGGSHAGLIIGLLVVAAAVTAIVLVANNDDDDDGGDDGSTTGVTLEDCYAQSEALGMNEGAEELSEECLTLIMSGSEEFTNNTPYCTTDEQIQVETDEIGWYNTTPEEVWDEATENDSDIEMTFDLQIHTSNFEQLSSNIDGFLQIDFSEIATGCGFEDLNFALNPELSEVFNSEYSDDQVFTISTNSAYELSTESCTAINIGELSFALSTANDLFESDQCDAVFDTFQAGINGDTYLSIAFLNDPEGNSEDEDDAVF